ncbi:MAG: hypothetical protein WEE89_12540, partial [Gemmatimonadota bacterium]
MSVPRSVAEILGERVMLTVECIDRLYLNCYVPKLQRALGVVMFFRSHRREPVASPVLMGRISDGFIRSIERFTREHEIPLITFEKGQRKEDVAREYRRSFRQEEGVVVVGTQEKAAVFRTEKRTDRLGEKYPWIVRSTAMVNQYYFYCVDADFGPFFLKFCSYFPYNAKLCLNGHEYVKRQLEQEGIGYEALDNGFLSCQDPSRLQEIADGLMEERISALLEKWLRRLPNPYTLEDTRAGYQYDLSILQAEFSLTHVLDSPRTGRIFFEEVIRENLDVGRPDQVQLIFGRRIRRTTPGRFRTRVLNADVVPSLHFDYKNTRIKQYHKEGRALRTETTINDTRDFQIGKRIKNLPALRQIGFAANRRLLHVQRLSCDCRIGEESFRDVTQPGNVQGQPVAALRFDDQRVEMLFAAVVMFRLLPRGFSNRDLRLHLAPLLGLEPCSISAGRMTYDLRRLRLHGLIERTPGSHRYHLTTTGLRTALFFTRAYARLLRPGISQLLQPPENGA